MNRGDIFGEDKLFNNRKNRFSVKVSSLTATVYYITIFNFEKNFNRAFSDLL